jgi:hypothetical protein
MLRLNAASDITCRHRSAIECRGKGLDAGRDRCTGGDFSCARLGLVGCGMVTRASIREPPPKEAIRILTRQCGLKPWRERIWFRLARCCFHQDEPEWIRLAAIAVGEGFRMCYRRMGRTDEDRSFRVGSAQRWIGFHTPASGQATTHPNDVTRGRWLRLDARSGRR